MIYIIMGVSGSGKSTIGKALAKELDIPFYDADDFHPQQNIDKMKSGQPLNDSDRKPWLEALANNMVSWQLEGGAVLACSALKETYRELLASKMERKDIQVVYLKGSFQLILDRMQKRKGHFFSANLLQTQFDTLEEPQQVTTVDIAKTEEEIIQEILQA